jgi:NTP pyrophosphatase (non-canonical NTP hydrolase)
MNKKYEEILRITQEECAEVIQAISKVFRFGFFESHPKQGPNNLEKLEEEIGDLLCMIDLLLENGLVNEDNLKFAAKAKMLKLKKWSNILDKDNLDPLE